MNIEICAFNDLDTLAQQQMAQMVSDYTHGAGGEQVQMLPVSPDEVHGKYAGVVALSDGEFAGYVGALDPLPHDGQAMLEVGSLIVPKEHRQHGNAHRLVGAITTLLVAQQQTPYAFCNPKSMAIFKDSGYRGAAVDEIPPGAFRACAGCPMIPPGGGCCDKVVVYEGAAA